MSQRVRRRAIAAGAMGTLALGLVACGGSSTRHEGEGAGGNEVGGTAGGGNAGIGGSVSVGGSAGIGVGGSAGIGVGASAGIGGNVSVGGSAGTGGNAGSAGVCVAPCVDRMLSDFETNNDGAHLQVGGINAVVDDCRVPTDPPRGPSLVACHLNFGPALGGANLGYHQHMVPFWSPSATDYDKPYAAVRFWARRGSAGGTSSLVVAVTGLEHELGSYQADLEAGNPWVAHRFSLTDEWQEHSALFVNFGPEGPGDAVSTWDSGGQVLHFVVPEGEPLDVWIDDIELECARDVCQ